MARYMKFEDVLNALSEVRCSDCTNDKPLDCSFCQIGVIHRQILAKTVYLDVAPKSEVAREIFEEIDEIKKQYASGDIDGNELYVRLYLLEKKYTEDK